MKKYRRCNRCVMSNEADDNISFDENGNCNYCNTAYQEMSNIFFPNEMGKDMLQNLVAHLKEKNKLKEYDCLMGISGGLDSCYLAYLGVVKWGLRIVAIHIDDGFDTELSRENIRKLCEKCNINLQIIRPNTKQFCELSRAYMLAGVPNLAVPQDNVLFSSIYEYAKKTKIHDFLSGSNFSLECILQKGNTHSCYDLINIKDINRKFGRDKINRLPLMSEWKKYREQLFMNVKVYAPLNYVDYRRENALKELKEFCGFEYYGSKHLENYFTGFLQLYWLPKKFGVDKRTSHLSSMIITEQISREEALLELGVAGCPKEWLEKAIIMVKQKLDIDDSEFDRIMSDCTFSHRDYKTDTLFNLYMKLKGQLKCLKGK